YYSMNNCRHNIECVITNNIIEHFNNTHIVHINHLNDNNDDNNRHWCLCHQSISVWSRHARKSRLSRGCYGLHTRCLTGYEYSFTLPKSSPVAISLDPFDRSHALTSVPSAPSGQIPMEENVKTQELDAHTCNGLNECNFWHHLRPDIYRCNYPWNQVQVVDHCAYLNWFISIDVSRINLSCLRVHNDPFSRNATNNDYSTINRECSRLCLFLNIYGSYV
ncbi:hypothetical protein AGLY_000114, partial [Aphis glycines]